MTYTLLGLRLAPVRSKSMTSKIFGLWAGQSQPCFIEVEPGKGQFSWHGQQGQKAVYRVLRIHSIAWPLNTAPLKQMVRCGSV